MQTLATETIMGQAGRGRPLSGPCGPHRHPCPAHFCDPSRIGLSRPSVAFYLSINSYNMPVRLVRC